MKQYNRTAPVLALALILLLGGVCSPSDAQQRAPTLPQGSDDNQCSRASLQGSYGYLSQGTGFAGGAPGLGVGVGIFIFDGNGNFSRHGTHNNQTLGVRHLSNTGAYTVNTDCTGSDVVQGGSTGAFVIIEGGNEIFRIGTEPNNIVTYTLKKQFPDARGGTDN